VASWRSLCLVGWPMSMATRPPYLVSAGIEVVALPFVLLARREQGASDPITGDLEPEAPPTAA
jgi:hypothetical protein